MTDAQLDFRLGVAHRKRFDASTTTGTPKADDFSAASLYWSKALKKNPNQYIWRRRIEQYGPRLAKPYPFYDWIETAQEEITARGETPIELRDALSGAEIAKQSRKFVIDETEIENPDPDSKVTVDTEGLVGVKATCVPAWTEPGKTVRVHLRFAPLKGEWNNEGQPLRVWLSNSEDIQLSSQMAESPNAAEANSAESRTIEFEIKLADTVQNDVEVSGFALYNTCEKESDQCLFRRMEFVVPIKIVKPN